MKINNKEYTLPAPWKELADDGESLIKELQKETSKNHLLYNKKCVPLARKSLQDDVLFFIPSMNKYVVVHLTWSEDVEPDPVWPETQVYDSVEDFLKLNTKG